MTERKRRIVLTPRQKVGVVEAVYAGGTIKSVAERFGVSAPTIRSIVSQYGELVPSDEPPAPSPKETAIQKLASMDDVGVLLDGNYIIIRFPKNKVTHALLAGVL